MIRKGILLLIILINANHVFAQTGGNEDNIQIKNELLPEIYRNNHPVFPDALFDDTSYAQSNEKPMPGFVTMKRSLTLEKEESLSVKVWPSVAMLAGSDLLNDDRKYDMGAGLNTVMRYKDDLIFRASYRYHRFNSYSFQEKLREKYKIIPGGPIALGQDYHDLHFRLSWKASEYFTIDGGFDEHFIGNGYRSLMLSDAGYAYPYFKLNANIWHFNYMALWINMKDFRLPGQSSWSDFKDKYAAIHYLSWQVSPRIRLGFFDAIIWQGENEAGERGFEVNYLNPLIFLRPVEFAVGSPDNAMMGFDFDVRLGSNMIYFQLMLDEFKFEEIKAMNGWWGNKQAFQLGWRSFDIAGQENLHALAEFNYIRPYMYSHRTPMQSYGNYNQPLAHPAGANVMEALLHLTYSRNRWFASVKNAFSFFGTSTGENNFGGDIFLDYNTRSKEYNNFVGQGIENKLFNHVAELFYMLNEKNNLNIFTRVAFRNHEIENVVNGGLFIEAGITNHPAAAANSWIDY